MRALWRFISGKRTAWAVLGATVVAVGLLFAFLPTPETDAYPASGLPDSTQSAQVAAALEDFPSAEQTAAILVWNREGG